jgi:AmmeMemoRadiSam system protein B
VSEPLPCLRVDLDFMPSPVAGRPGLFIRDPYGFSSAALIIPPPLIRALGCFDGEQTELELRKTLYEITGQLDVSGLADDLRSTLDKAGFLQNECFHELRAARIREFEQAPERLASHAGTAYPDHVEPLRALLDERLGAPQPLQAPAPVAIAAPHISLDGGWASYRAAYRSLQAANDDRVFVILGTSHYGEPDRFGLTRKPYITPFGAARTETRLVEFLAGRAPAAVQMEDYCHAIEHSIEFQVVFLQAIFGSSVRILPILCGPFARSIQFGGLPESDDAVMAFLEALGELADREKEGLTFVLGVDMAHIGRRYQDNFSAEAGCGVMSRVEERDRARIACLAAGDAEGFWALVQENHDDLRWCGSAPFYILLRALPSLRGTLHNYEQWNIDEASVVTFGALSFTR